MNVPGMDLEVDIFNGLEAFEILGQAAGFQNDGRILPVLAHGIVTLFVPLLRGSGSFLLLAIPGISGTCDGRF
jgi:hypothetical protein